MVYHSMVYHRVLFMRMYSFTVCLIWASSSSLTFSLGDEGKDEILGRTGKNTIAQVFQLRLLNLLFGNQWGYDKTWFLSFQSPSQSQSFNDSISCIFLPVKCILRICARADAEIGACSQIYSINGYSASEIFTQFISTQPFLRKMKLLFSLF